MVWADHHLSLRQIIQCVTTAKIQHEHTFREGIQSTIFQFSMFQIHLSLRPMVLAGSHLSLRPTIWSVISDTISSHPTFHEQIQPATFHFFHPLTNRLCHISFLLAVICHCDKSSRGSLPTKIHIGLLLMRESNGQHFIFSCSQPKCRCDIWPSLWLLPARRGGSRLGRLRGGPWGF